MWLSRHAAVSSTPPQEAAIGQVSIASDGVAAVSDAEYRNLRLVSPGGFAWKPDVSDRILIMKDTAFGLQQDCPVELAPGEACLFSNGCYIHMKHDGSIRIQGTLYLNGNEVHGDGE